MEPIADILERFFVEVLVMCEDEQLRDNRIALLKELGRQFHGACRSLESCRSKEANSD